MNPVLPKHLILTRKIISNSESSDSECEPDEVNYFAWTTIEKRITKATYTVGFDDAVALLKEKVKILKKHIFIKRVQNAAYVQHKTDLADDELLEHVDFAKTTATTNKMRSKAHILDIRASPCSHTAATLKMLNKSWIKKTS